MTVMAKFAIAALALAGSGAFAAIDLPSTGNGELVLLVRDRGDPTRQVAVETDIRLDDILTQAQIVATTPTPIPRFGVPSEFNLSFGDVTSAELASFLSVPAAFGYEYMVFAGDSSETRRLGDARFLSTSSIQLSALAPSAVVNNALGNASGLGITSELQLEQVNTSLAEQGGTKFAVISLDQSSFFFSEPGLLGFPLAGTPVGSATNLYVFTTAGGGSGSRARVYKGNDIVLKADGTLSVVERTSSPVPLPAAVWLLGSALATCRLVGRRTGRGFGRKPGVSDRSWSPSSTSRGAQPRGPGRR